MNLQKFFELNGQTRTAKVPNRTLSLKIEKRPQGDPENPDHGISPMPGMIPSVSVSVGQYVQAGDVLLTIEAMEMETAIRTAVATTIHSILVAVGENVDTKDLLIELKAKEES